MHLQSMASDQTLHKRYLGADLEKRPDQETSFFGTDDENDDVFESSIKYEQHKPNSNKYKSKKKHADEGFQSSSSDKSFIEQDFKAEDRRSTREEAKVHIQSNDGDPDPINHK